jgi:hypothetical protein
MNAEGGKVMDNVNALRSIAEMPINWVNNFDGGLQKQV